MISFRVKSNVFIWNRCRRDAQAGVEPTLAGLPVEIGLGMVEPSGFVCQKTYVLWDILIAYKQCFSLIVCEISWKCATVVMSTNQYVSGLI